MNYLNTDTYDYHHEILKDGFPPSSLKTRRFQPSGFGKDQIIPFDDNTDWYLRQKARIIKKNPNKYHRSLLSDECEYILAEKIRTIAEMGSEKIEPNTGIYRLLHLVPSDVVFCHMVGGEFRLGLVHLAFPNGWGADEAIGQPFSFFHQHVKDTAERQVVPSNHKFIENFVNAPHSFERVGAFSIKPSAQLDRHPSTVDKQKFVYDKPIFLRFERQVIHPVPELHGFLFFIHTHLIDMRIDPEFFLNAIEHADKDCYIRHVLEMYGEYFKVYLRKQINA